MIAKRSNITGFTLKWLAIVGMTANHVAHIFSTMLPELLTAILYSFGGLTFPIMAFLIVEGYLHTSNIKKYAGRLAVFAVISQVPFSLIWGPTGNVFITLLIGLGLLWAYDNIKSTPLFALVLMAGVGISFFCDWQIQGPIIILAFYVLRGKGKKGIALTMLIPYAVMLVMALVKLPPEISRGFIMGENAIAAGIDDAFHLLDVAGMPLVVTNQTFLEICHIGYAVVGYSLAMFFIMRYNGERGRSMKWFFYVYYPLHLLILWAIRYCIIYLPL